MAYWLMKSEPDVFSFDDLVAKTARGETEEWTEVRNYAARNNMKAMAVGDEAFFYHSNIGKEIVGIVEIVREHYPDPTDASGKFVCVDVKAVKAMPKPVTLAAIKADARFAEMALIKLSRLSVQPVTATEWKALCKMGGL